jgi:hypothetical protein
MSEQEQLTPEDEDVGEVSVFEVYLKTGGIGVVSTGTVSPARHAEALVAGAGILVRAAAESAGGPGNLSPGVLRDYARVLLGQQPHRERS